MRASCRPLEQTEARPFNAAGQRADRELPASWMSRRMAETFAECQGGHPGDDRRGHLTAGPWPGWSAVEPALRELPSGPEPGERSRYSRNPAIRNLGGRELAETRRAVQGIQVRLTPAGIKLPGKRERREAGTAVEIDWAGIADGRSASILRASPSPVEACGERVNSWVCTIEPHGKARDGKTNHQRRHGGPWPKPRR
jgi:hypothetical protein